MAKIYGLFGSMTGKLADVVMAVRNGEQIARKYQPVVANPSTEAQVATRARLKLMSQLSAIMAPVIAIPGQGPVSSRNLFIKKNFALSSYSGGQADITLANVQLTSSVVGLPNVRASRVTEPNDAILVRLESAFLDASGEPLGVDVDRVVYCMFVKGDDGKLRYQTSAIATAAGADYAWSTVLPATNREVVVLAYGVRDNNEASRAVFGNLTAPTAEAIAKLLVTRTLLESDVTLTETRGATLSVASSRDVVPESEEKTTKKK